LFGASLLSSVVAAIISLITGSTDSVHFLNYMFFNVLAPVGSIAPVFGNGAGEAGKGMQEFGSEIATLGLWTVAFFASAWFFFRRGGGGGGGGGRGARGAVSLGGGGCVPPPRQPPLRLFVAHPSQQPRAAATSRRYQVTRRGLEASLGPPRRTQA